MITVFRHNEFTPMYIDLLRTIANEGTLEGKTRDLLGVQLILTDPKRSLLFFPKNWKWCFQELFDRMSGILGAPSHCQNPGLAYNYRPVWKKKLQKEGGTFDYAYGNIYKIQVPAIIAQLKKQKTTREAIINIWQKEYLINQSNFNRRPCTLTLHFILRDNKLHLFVNMRSNDAINLLPYDVFHHTFLQRYIAAMIEKNVGHYHHFASHMYYPKRREMSGRNYVEKATKVMEKGFKEVSPYTPPFLFRKSIEQDMLYAIEILHFHKDLIHKIESPLIENMINFIQGDPVINEFILILPKKNK